MLTKVNSAAPYGIDPVGISVEVNVSERGMPYFDIIGLPNKSIEESKHRVRTALQNSGIPFPNKKIVVNLAPADIPKTGSFYDLPIAVGILSYVKKLSIPEKALFYGELSLDGGLRHTKGVFLLALHAQSTKYKTLFIPDSCVVEAASIPDIEVCGVSSLRELVRVLEQECRPAMPISKPSKNTSGDPVGAVDMCEIVGQEQAKRALEISATGGHNLIMVGPPGVGKTMLAKAFSSILPPLTPKESLEVTRIYSAVGKILPGFGLISVRPFRSPHHTITYTAMIGGGVPLMPGEITLSHRGVLFLDELPEFSRTVLEALRQPIEEGRITLVRSRGSVTFPSRILLLASSNPCPCGYFGDPENKCRCTPRQVELYVKKLSGPILDRVDLHIYVKNVEGLTLSKNPQSEASETIRVRVMKAREIQEKRFFKDTIFVNAEMSNPLIEKYCRMASDVENLITNSVYKFKLSARAFYKIIKVARTIADLDCSEDIKLNHAAEALQYRVRSF